ncbi:MAG: TerB family tellurite resistance protein [Flavobacteriales bacterium]|nr:TerB family tellurite resistance protein [Flavobacteriales bacterium]
MNHQLFYKELGRLLYAIAAADGTIAKAEVERLHRIVAQELVPAEPATDKYGTDQAWITEFEFDVLADQGADPNGEFRSFIAYLRQHRKEVTSELRDTVLGMARSVAGAFHGINSAEAPLLAELERELDDLVARR